MFKRFIGDRAMYRRFLLVVVPIIIQNGITNFVSLLDNIMVGQVGTVPMSGVSIVNTLVFVFNLCVFGACSGAGIFTAQFVGSRDDDGVRYSFRYKVLVCLLIALVGIGIFMAGGAQLIRLYLQGDGDAATASGALAYGLEYLQVMLWGFIPFALTNAYSSTLRESGQTMVPMIGGVAAVAVNLILNYVLIFGHFGAPEMGVAGAALATVISRFAELAIVAGWTHLHGVKNPFICGAFRSVYIPGRLFRDITVKGMPLLVNEIFWSTGTAVLSQCYSTCGLDVVPAMNIATTINNLANVVFLSCGSAVGILMGQMLGSSMTRAQIQDANVKLTAASVAAGSVFGVLLAAVSGAFPMIYNTTDSVRQTATQLILVSAAMMPFNSYLNAAYFTLRSGGKTIITFVFDGGFVWCVNITAAFLLSRFTDIPILPMFIICQGLDLLKCLLGWYMLKKGTWIQNLVQ